MLFNSMFLSSNIVDFRDPDSTTLRNRTDENDNPLPDKNPTETWSADEFALADFFNFSFISIGNGRQVFSDSLLGENYPWKFSDWLEVDPSKEELTSAWLSWNEGTSFPPVGDASALGKPLPRPLYFAYCSQQGMARHEYYTNLKMDSKQPLLVDLVFNEEDHLTYIPEEGLAALTPSELNQLVARHLAFHMEVPKIQKQQAIKILGDKGYPELAADVEGYNWDTTSFPSTLPDPLDQQVGVPHSPFWHWGPLPRSVYPIVSSSLVPIGWVPPADDCPPSYPSCMLHLDTYELVVELIESTKVVDSVVTEYEVIMPEGRGNFRLPNGMYSGAFFSSPFPEITETSPPIPVTTTSANTVVTTDGGVTTEVIPAQYRVFKVYEYIWGTRYKRPGVVGGYTEPILYLLDESGRSVYSGSPRVSTEESIIIKEAEQLAVKSLIESWGFYPPAYLRWYGPPEAFVRMWRGELLHNLPLYQTMNRYGSIGVKMQIMRGFAGLFEYSFDVVVALQPASITRVTTNNVTTVTTETIETVAERDPVTYTYSNTVETISHKARMRLSWRKLPQENYTIGFRNFRGVGQYFPAIGEPPTWEAIEFLLKSPTFPPSLLLSPSHKLQDPYGTGRYTSDRDAREIPSLTMEQSYSLFKGLFTESSHILQYLNFGEAAVEKANGALGQSIGYFPGTTYLSQQGTAAPIYPTFTGSLVLDTHLKKWGKLDKTHKLLLDLTPVNSHRQNRINPSTFSIQAAMHGVDGKSYIFDTSSNDSEIRFGKLGYYRLGFTELEEVRINYAKGSTGFVQVEPSISGDAPEAGLVEETPFTGVTQTITNYTQSARWYNITVKGQFDLTKIEFIGQKASRR